MNNNCLCHILFGTYSYFVGQLDKNLLAEVKNETYGALH